MATPRIPLPKKTEQVHRDKKSQYNRRQGKQISLEDKEEIPLCPTLGEKTKNA